MTSIPRLEFAINPPGADPLTEVDRVKGAVMCLPPEPRAGVSDASRLTVTQVQGGITNRLYKVDLDAGRGSSSGAVAAPLPPRNRAFAHKMLHRCDHDELVEEPSKNAWRTELFGPGMDFLYT